MKTQTQLLLLTATMLAIVVMPLRAQVVADGATATLDNVSINAGNFLTVGTNGANTLLIVTNAATVKNLQEGYIGFNPSANHNQVIVTGTNSQWNSANYLNVGYSGSFNTLLIAQGGRMADRIGFLGRNPNANNNQVTVTGPGSDWFTSGDLALGDSGAFNTLLITNGGKVGNDYGYVGGVTTASNNQIIVTGPDSRWTSRTNLHIGRSSSGNTLLIADGGQVANAEGVIGFVSDANNNHVTVTGPNSVWTNSGNLLVGWDTSGNTLLISDGGQVTDFYGAIGFHSGANNNQVTVTGPNSLWNNRTDLFVGWDGRDNTLLITNGGTAFAGGCLVIGTNSVLNALLVTAGALLTNSFDGVLGAGIGANSNTAFLSGLNTRWLMGGNMHLGSNGCFNRLVITNGALVGNDYGYLGDITSSSNNEAVVTGVGSLWANRQGLHVGNSGSGNWLVITNGGVARSLYGLLGLNSDSGGNLAVVTGAGSVWTNSGGLSIGNSGAGNMLLVTNGGRVTDTFAFIGANTGASNNQVTVSGTNSVWANSGNLVIGSNSVLNALLVTGGGRVANNIGYLGFNASASNNQVVVTGTNSMWTISSALNVGNSGSFNTLLLANGGRLLNGTGFVGANSTANNNQVIVTGAGSVWTNSSDLYIGFGGAFNQLTVSNSAVVANAAGIIGNTGGANGNSVLIAGPGSLWTNNSHLTIGSASAFNQLVVSNGGLVRNLTGTVGSSSGAKSNLVLVTGAGSLWANSGSLLVGSGGTFNRLVVSEGGVVVNTGGTVVGNNPGLSGNAVLVTGPGSLWTNSASLTLGSAGSFNQLVVSNGGAVRAVGLVTVGSTPIATNNSVLADGGLLASVGLTLGGTVSRNNSITLVSNSTWNVGGGTFIWGNAGLNDTLVIDATSALTNLGALTLDENNTAFFMTNAPGGYSLNGWTTNQFQFKPGGIGAVIVGHSGTNVQLTINDYVLADTTGTIGNSGGANSNSVVVTGAGSLWTNNGSLTVGNNGVFNQLVVSNGGVVRNTSSTLGSSSGANSNVVVVTGAGSLWSSSSSLLVGSGGTFNRLVISEGGVVANTTASVGNNPGLSGNVMLVTGAGSRWINSSSLTLGSGGSFNQLVVSNGAVVGSTSASLGSGTAANSNVALITGAGSLWTNSAALTIGNVAAFNQLVINNGAQVANSVGYLGFAASSSTNEAVVTGVGSLWNNRSELYVGNASLGNRLTITNGGTVVASNAVYLGFNATAGNNLLTVGGGGLIVTNPAGSGVLDIRRGTSVLNSGTMDADRLLLTNSQGLFTFNGGTLKTKGTTSSNGQLFTVGNGTSPATLELVGNGLHTFANGLAIANNALLRGNGTIGGTLNVAVGGTLSPGTSVGKIVLNTPPVLSGSVFMEISKSGAVLTNDQIQVAGALAYGGSLTVSNLGPDILALNNSFPLFSATSYSGAFTAITLPTLPAGLSWTNRLLANGSIAVVNKIAPGISGVAQNGTNLVSNITGGSPGGAWNLLTATNVTLPLLSWTTNSSGVFDWLGNVSLTNGINLTEPQRFYRISAP